MFRYIMVAPKWLAKDEYICLHSPVLIKFHWLNLKGKNMTVSLQVLYPTDNETTFDHAYYGSKHMEIVGEHMGPHIKSTTIVKGLAGGPDTPPGFHAIATITFETQDALNAALAAGGPAMADIPNFYSGQPQVLIGEVTG